MSNVEFPYTCCALDEASSTTVPLQPNRATDRADQWEGRGGKEILFSRVFQRVTVRDLSG